MRAGRWLGAGIEVAPIDFASLDEVHHLRLDGRFRHLAPRVAQSSLTLQRSATVLLRQTGSCQRAKLVRYSGVEA